MRDDILRETRERMQKAVQHFTDELRGVRTGRAAPGLVEGIRVNYYGSLTPLKQLATISIPEPRQIVIKPFDPSVAGEVEKAIQKSDLGITPQADGKLIRLNLPPMSQEQRDKTVARVKEMAEECRVSVRNIRRDGNRRAEQAGKDKILPEDDVKSLQAEIQEQTRKSEKEIDEVLKSKSEEIRSL
ncbi:MAG: ribosome recycling factor [Planctomycetes bacterium]|nr:ribosome recycling factor [Planctomycetota bacterium]